MDLTLPASPETENTLIGLVFGANSLIWRIVETLKFTDFYVDNNQKIIEAMISLADLGKPIDYLTVQEQIKTKHSKIIEKATLATYLDHLPDNPQIEEYIEIVYSRSIERQKAKLHNAAQTAIMTGKESATIQAKLEDVAHDRRKQSFEHVSHNSISLLSEIYEHGLSGNHLTGLKSGYRKLDYLTSGLQKQDLIVLAARPSVGKTSYATCLAENICEITPEAVICMFSLEMSKKALKKRLLSSMSRVDAQKIKSGFLEIEEWARLLAAKRRLDKFKLFINDDADVTVLEMKAKAKILLNEQKRLDLIIVDYLQLMGSDEKVTNIEQETSKKSKGLKNIAKELDVPVLVLSQLSRAPEGRNDHRPQLSDLRYSGSIEQDSDIVAMLYREELYEKTDDNGGLTELILAKQRNGPTGTVPLYFIKGCTRFEGLSAKYVPNQSANTQYLT